MDGGPGYLMRKVSLHGSAEEIYLRASRTIGRMILELVEEQPQRQPEEELAVAFERRYPADSDLWDAISLEQTYDLIRMVDAEIYPHT